MNMLAALALMLCVTSCGTKQEVKQEPETAAEAVKKMIAGWNVGNDMDCFDSDLKPGSPLEEYERSWGQSPANELMFKNICGYLCVWLYGEGTVTSLTFSGNLAVMHTPPGHAGHVAYDIDNAHLPEVLGTIAGDDTVLIVLDEKAERKQVMDAIAEIQQSGI